MKSIRTELSHIRFSILFTASLYVVCNSFNIDRIARWFAQGDGYDFSGLIAFLIFGLCFFMALFVLLAHRWTIKAAAIGFILASAAGTYFISKYHVAIDRTMVMNAVYTDITEVRSLLSFRMLPYVLFLMVIPILLVVHANITFQKTGSYLLKSFVLFLMALGMGVGLVYLEYPSIHRAANSSNKYILNSLIPVNIINSLGSALHKSTASYLQQHKKNVEIVGHVTSEEDLVVVLAIGETARQKNFSLYGYNGNNTNPALSRYRDLYALNGKARVGTTLLALPEILEKDDIKLTAFTAKLEINTSCLVNFSLYDNCESVEEVPVSNCGHNGKCYDEDVIPLLRANLQSYKNGHRLVVLHFGGGSHGPVYRDRHPPEFERFKPQCLDADVVNQCSLSQLYNSYDNTILYADYVISEAIEALDLSGVPYVFIYLSDHGESLLEDGLIFHGMPPGIPLPPEQADIPLIIKSSMTLSIADREEYLQNDVYDTVLSLLSIDSETINKERIFIQVE